MPRKPARRNKSRASRRKKSPIVPALVLITAAGSATVTGFVFFSRNTPTRPDDAGIGMAAPDVAAIGAGGGAQITLNDKNDSTRRFAVINFDSQTPIGQGRYDTVNPRAWVYLKDGRYLHIRADQGRFYAPDEQRPQSGVMRGNVVVRLFEPAPQRPAEDAEAPIIARLDSLEFDTDYGALSTPVPGLVVTPQGEFRFNDLRVVINQVQERIELLEVRRGGRITYTPAAPTPGGTPGSPDPASPAAGDALAAGPPTGGPGTSLATRLTRPIATPGAARTQPGTIATPATRTPVPPPPAEAPATTYYLAQFREGVRLNQDAVTATGDALDVFARLIDNKLPDGAIGGRTALGDDRVPVRLSASAQIQAVLASMVVATAESRWPPMNRLRHLPAAPPTPPTAAESDQLAPPGQAIGPAAEPASGETPARPQRRQPAPRNAAPRELPTPGLSSNAPVTLDWAGPLTLRPLATEPTELRRDHLAARLTGGEGGGVNLLDTSSGASGVCTRLEYAFTTRNLVLAGVGDGGMRLSAGGGDVQTPGARPASETLRAARAEYSLGTGIGRVPGPGTLEGDAFQRIAWNEQMDFVLRSEGGRVLSSLEEVMFRGDVRGEDDAASFDAGFARAEFLPGPDDGTALSAITLEEAVTLRGRDEERVSAESVRVEFEPPAPGEPGEAAISPGEPESVSDGEPVPASPDQSVAAPGAQRRGSNPQPSWFEADGGVIAIRPGERLVAEHVEATLSPGADRHPVVQTLHASGGVDLRTRREGIEIIGEDVAADVPAQRLFVLGTTDRLARVTRGRTTVSGVDIRLAGRPRSAEVRGAGTFAHAADDSQRRPGSEREAVAPTTFDASWTQSMTFDDALGTLRCVGEVAATMKEGSARSDRLTAAIVEATLEPAAAAPEPLAAATTSPGPSGALPTEPAAPDTSGPLVSADTDVRGDGILVPIQSPAEQNRKVLTMVATGSIVDDPESGRPATIESRRYAPPGGDGVAVLQQLLYLEGARILADNQAGTLDVPGQGKLMVVDRRAPEGERAANAAPFEGETARGDALFNWKGSLHVDRPATGNRATMTMTDQVEMIHRRTGDDLITQLKAPTLTARSGGDNDGDMSRLRAVHAEGGVWVASGDREVTADIIDYDADTGILTAFSTFGNPVRVMEGAAVWSAGAVRWDMTRGRIEIVDPGGLVSPR